MAKLGSMAYQLTELVDKDNGCGINQVNNGTSKVLDRANAIEELKAEGRPSTSENISEKTGIHSGNTLKNNLSDWIQAANWIKGNCLDDDGNKIKSIYQIDENQIASYLQNIIADDKIKESTFDKDICSSMNKFDNALSMGAEKLGLEKRYDFSEVVAEAKELADGKLGVSEGNQPFQDSGAIIDYIRESGHPQAEKFAVACEVMLELGVRSGEIKNIKMEHLGDEKITFLNMKNGINETKFSSSELVEKIKENMTDGEFKVNYRELAEMVVEAREATGQQGTCHSFRYEFACEKYVTLRSEEGGGLSHMEACYKISDMMNHQRGEITEKYISSVSF